MTTHVPEIHVRRPHVNAWLVAVVALSAALVALGAWVLVDRYAGGDSATQDATALVDGWNAAVNAKNPADAIAPLITSDFEARTSGRVLTADEFLASATWYAVGAERIAPVTVAGDFATTYSTLSVRPGTQLALFQFEDGKISRFWSFELGSTPPFDNVARP